MSVTICIPIAPYHEQLAERAIRSANSQTIPCEVLTLVDREKRGPGFMRNRLLEKVTTPYIVFLDADDWLELTFAEETLKAIKPHQYVYTDWFADGIDNTPRSAPDRAWCAQTWHVITTLLPTDVVRQVGGFDEQLSALEDTDFYMKIITRMCCGIHLRRPLFHYSGDGQRSKAIHDTPLEKQLLQGFVIKYGGRMSCCGGSGIVQIVGEGKQPGDVLAQTLWGGNHTEHGRISGRIYPRSGNGRLMWVDPRDASASPHLWRVVEQPTETTAEAPIQPDFQKVLDLAEQKPEVDESAAVKRIKSRGRSA